MFKSNLLIPQYQNLLGWRQWDNQDEFQIDEQLTETETGEFFQQKHPALQLNYIQTCLDPSIQLDDYLLQVVNESTVEIFNDLMTYRQLNRYGKTLLDQAVLLNRYGWTSDKITNQGRFVGFQIRPRALSGLSLIIEQIGLQFYGTEHQFNLYLFHSSKKEALKTIQVNVDGNGGWNWTLGDSEKIELSSFTGTYNGGVFILGYYQDDILPLNAINYTNFNWDSGVCGSCNDTNFQNWRSIKEHFLIYPFYVAGSNYEYGEMFDMNKMVYTNNLSFGLNLKLSVICDLTEFFIQNRFVFKNLLATKVMHKVLGMMKFSQNINSISENIKMMIIRDLEGDIETKLTNIPTLYDKELKAVAFNIESINGTCLGCEKDTTSPSFGYV